MSAVGREEPLGFDRTFVPALCPARSGQPITRTCREERERKHLSRSLPPDLVLDPKENSVGSA